MCNDENIYSFHSIRNNKTTINCSIWGGKSNGTTKGKF
jgi:hypothetical protein